MPPTPLEIRTEYDIPMLYAMAGDYMARMSHLVGAGQTERAQQYMLAADDLYRAAKRLELADATTGPATINAAMSDRSPRVAGGIAS